MYIIYLESQTCTLNFGFKSVDELEALGVIAMSYLHCAQDLAYSATLGVIRHVQ